MSVSDRVASLTRARRHVVAFVDDDDVPPGVLEVVAVLEVALEGVNRDDASVEVVEWVVVRGDAIAHAGQTYGVQAYQRDGKAAPPLLLELGEHGLLRDDQNAFAAPSLDELGGKDGRLQRLAQADRVGDEDA
jgi:hypothetical protein